MLTAEYKRVTQALLGLRFSTVFATLEAAQLFRELAALCEDARVARYYRRMMRKQALLWRVYSETFVDGAQLRMRNASTAPGSNKPLLSKQSVGRTLGLASGASKPVHMQSSKTY